MNTMRWIYYTSVKSRFSAAFIRVFQSSATTAKKTFDGGILCHHQTPQLFAENRIAGFLRNGEVEFAVGLQPCQDGFVPTVLPDVLLQVEDRFLLKTVPSTKPV